MDAPELPHLPDLPTAGYATRREKALTDEIMFYLRELERDRFQLLRVVIAGKDECRRILKQAWRHLKADDDVCDAVYGYACLLAGPNPHMQLAELANLERIKVVGRMQREQEVYQALTTQTGISGRWKLPRFGVLEVKRMRRS